MMKKYLAIIFAMLAFPQSALLAAFDLKPIVTSEIFWKPAESQTTILRAFGGCQYRKTSENSYMLMSFQGQPLAFGEITFPSFEFEFAGTDEAKIVTANSILYNRGDNGDLEVSEFNSRVKNYVSALTKIFGEPVKSGKTPKKNAVTDEDFWDWKWENGAARLTAGTSKSSGKSKDKKSKKSGGNGPRAEYIRLIFMPSADELELGGGNDTEKRSDVKKSHLVVDNAKKRVYIKDIPMVDQGQKGYCVPAAVARIFALYGMESIDQHALAAICNSSADKGTDLLEMERSLQTIARKFHMKLTPFNKKADWVKDYNKIAKKKGVPELAGADLQSADAAVLLEARGKKAAVQKWMTPIRKSINNGVPVLWSVTLGIYREPINTPQTRGGHMRLIIGYDDTAGTILFSDTWGARHELKELKQAEACAITTWCYELKPTK